jgi:hypothetical protein
MQVIRLALRSLEGEREQFEVHKSRGDLRSWGSVNVSSEDMQRLRTEPSSLMSFSGPIRAII